MNLAYRSKFKQITKIEYLGSTLKGEEILITLGDGRKVKTFGDIICSTVNRFNEEESIRAKELTTDISIKIDQFMDQL